MKYMAPAALMLVALCVFALSGCGSDSGKKSGSAGESPAGESGDHKDGDHEDHGKHSDSGQSPMEKMKTELAKLSPADAASAEKQHMCPVTGEMLGTMGAPKKIEVKGQQVWICCDHCKEKILAKPDEYLAKLKK